MIKTSGRFPNTMYSKYYNNELEKKPRASTCSTLAMTGASCGCDQRCESCKMWASLPSVWQAQGAAVLPNSILSVQPPKVVDPMEVEVVDASTAMATNSARAYSDAQLGLVWARILAAHFGVDATRANNDAIQILLNEPLLKATIKGFAPTCERYHKAIGDHAMMNRTRNRHGGNPTREKGRGVTCVIST
jgi:hypothetical protein